MSEWKDATQLANRLGVSCRALSTIGRGYTDGISAAHPVLRRHDPARAGGQRSYVYRLDPEPRWHGEQVRDLVEAMDVECYVVAERLDITETAPATVIREDRWMGRPTWSGLDELAENVGLAPPDPVVELIEPGTSDDGHEPDTDCWYAVCDDVCGRYVVEKVVASLDKAEQLVHGTTYSHETCDGRVFRGEGPEPTVGESMDVAGCEEVTP